MIFVEWGHKGEIKHQGVVAPSMCPTCEKARPFEHVVVQKRAQVYWIPTWSYDKHHFLACAFCQASIELTKAQLQVVETMKPITQSWEVDAITDEEYWPKVGEFWAALFPQEQETLELPAPPEMVVT
jgi:hypothetical protein